MKNLILNKTLQLDGNGVVEDEKKANLRISTHLISQPIGVKSHRRCQISFRCPCLLDGKANRSGAWLGGLIFVFLKKTLKEERTGRLPTLELPLMYLVYLLIPLMWLTGLSAGQEVLRWWLMVLLGLFGGGVLFSIYFYRLRDGGSVGPNKLSCLAMGWFFIGALTFLRSGSKNSIDNWKVN